MSDFNPQYPNESEPRITEAQNPSTYYNQLDPSSFPGSYNYKKFTYDGTGNVTQIDFYNGATSFSNSGSLVFTQQYQYSGSVPTDFLITIS